MMYVSQYLLSLRDCRALRLTDSYSLHRAVYGLFPDVRHGAPGSSGILFADKGGSLGMRRILVLSDREAQTPACGRLESRALPEGFLDFSEYRFEIIVNPVCKSRASGKREAVRGRPAVEAWFLKKAPSWGFQPAPETVQVADISVDVFDKGDKRVTLGKARVTGILAVTDKERFRLSFTRGIGHGKAFGCGLLQISPLLFR